tara:strand:- start:534 stop:947 length:414 start_codon:yes stop_codon:yes gene_type:complete
MGWKDLSAAPESSQGKDPYKELWSAVLAKAVRDAFTASDWVLARSAIAWLKSYNSDFKTVCEYAGRNPQYVYKKIIRPLNQREGYLNGIKKGNHLSSLPRKWIHESKADDNPNLEFWSQLSQNKTMSEVSKSRRTED